MRYVLKRQSGGATEGCDPRSLAGLEVVDQASEDWLLVEAEPEAIERHRTALAGWTAAPETTFGLPGLGREEPPD